MARRTATRALATDAVNERVLYSPRSYQKPVLDAMAAGIKRFVTVWHRRAGKDRTWLAIMLTEMLKRRGVYVTIFPTLTQARRDIWDARIDDHDFLDIFPHELRAEPPNETELQIKLVNGSIWQLLGADDPKAIDRLRGMNPIGVVFSEYSVTDPEAWAVLAPAFLENQGWAAFAFTPKGRNHGWKLWQAAQSEPAWFTSFKTVDDTRRDGAGESGEVVITHEAIRDEQRVLGWSEEFVQQEFWCSFDASLVGSYYGDQLREAERDGRVTRVPWHPTTPVITAWDLGYDDYTAVWFVQPVGRELRVIDYLEASGEWMPFYAKRLKELEYVYDEHLLPHDADADNVRGPTIQNQLRELKIGRTRIIPKDSVQDGIQAVRALFPKLVFDEVKTRLGRERLASYVKEPDAHGYYKAKPKHDAASDAADALRTLAMGLRIVSDQPRQTQAASATTDVFGDARAMRARYAQSGTAAW